MCTQETADLGPEESHAWVPSIEHGREQRNGGQTRPSTLNHNVEIKIEEVR